MIENFVMIVEGEQTAMALGVVCSRDVALEPIDFSLFRVGALCFWLDGDA